MSFPHPPRTIPFSLPPRFHDTYTEVLVGLGLMTPPAAVQPVVLPRKRKRASTNIRTRGPYDRLMSAARAITRAVSPYVDVHDLMLWGPLAKWGKPTNGTDAAEESISVEARRECEEGFCIILATIPDLELILKQLYIDSIHDQEPWAVLVSRMSTAARDVRQYDTGEYRNKDRLIVPNPNDCLYPPLSEDTKSDRGESHRVLRLELLGWRKRLLLPPVSYKEPTDETTTTFVMTQAAIELDKQLTGGTYEFKHTVMPSCFYAVDSYDATRYWIGLFKGVILVRILRFMLTGPKSMLVRADRLGTCNARLMNIYTITPRLVAYAAVQARTMMSKSDWTLKDGNYDYTRLFALVLDVFAEEDLVDWSQETLAWLQSEVFGTISAPASSPNTSNDDDDEDDEIAVQRRARRTAAVPAGPA
ncbi:hypothetical protein C8F01DRAFT_1258693 [Mycena amicta]|nr:hypothetical protein C8F01DRAFT_1258693 [Mycena amicta]